MMRCWLVIRLRGIVCEMESAFSVGRWGLM